MRVLMPRAWARVAYLAVFCLVAVSVVLPAVAAPQARAVFGPETFVRTSGATTVITREVRVPAHIGAPITLHIVNGAPDGSNGSIPHAVSSATVHIDGQEVVHQNELSSKTATIEKTIVLAPGTHQLEARLNGAPDDFFTLTIRGSIALADLHEARSGHTATLLGDGSVVIAGGRNGGGTLSSAERFDGAALTTAPLPASMTARRGDHAAATLARPQTLLVGGSDGTATHATAEVFDHAAGAFQALAATTQITRSGATATILPDGRVLILGGLDASGNTVASSEAFDPLTAAIYDPAAGVFRFLPNALAVPRANHTATLLPDGTILVAGGRNAGGLLASAEVFNPATGNSTPLAAAMTVARAEHAATLLPDGSVLLTGGRGTGGLLASTDVFQRTTNGFTAGTATLLVARANHTATLLPSGELLIAGGDAASGPTKNTELVGPPAADSTAPAVAAVLPVNGALGIERNTIISIRFSEPVNPLTVNAQTVRLTTGATSIAATVTISEAGLVAFLVPAAQLLPGTGYTVTVAVVRDLAGNAIAATSSAFTTIFPPTIAGFAPVHGLPGTVVTLTGEHFEPTPAGNTVTVGGQPATVSAASATSLTITIPALAAGPHRIRVETRGGAAEAADAFVVDNPVPVLVSVTPDEAPAGSPAVTVTIAGTSFTAGATAMLGAMPLATQFVSPQQLTAVIPAAELTSSRTLQLTVVNPVPGGGASNALTFTVKTSRASIGDFVWLDLNNDGVQDANEQGVSGVTVRLLDRNGNLLDTTTTDNAGAYRFSDLAPADYRVEFVAPDGYAFAAVHAIGDNDADSDADPETGRSDLVSLGAGGDTNNVDAGLYTPPTKVTTSPSHGEANVAVTRETIFRLTNALADNAVLDGNAIRAEHGGARLTTRVHVAPDRKTVTLFYDRDLPASARIRVTLDGNVVRDRFGAPLDANNDGTAGGVAQIDFDTVTLTTLPDTKVCGRVFASQLAPNGTTSVNVPLAGVTITVDGLETTLRTTTDAQGSFCLDPAPVGDFFVHIDGRTATNPTPAGDYYPVVGKLWQSAAGVSTTIEDIFLPLIVAGTLQPVSRTSDTPVAFPPAVLAQFPQFAGVQLTVPADSLYSDDGSRGGRVGIAPVPPDRLPEPLPQGLTFPIVITVQTDGGANFDQPVPACFPNLPNASGQTLQPGDKSALWSFNHDTGHFEIVGSMTVSADGALVCTDEGVGILAPGWHGTNPGTSGNSDPPADPPDDDDDDDDDEEDEPDCDDIKNKLNNDYANKVGTAAAVLSHQLACLANNACSPSAPPFVKNVLDKIADNLGNNTPQNLCDNLPGWIPIFIPPPGGPVPPIPWWASEICAIPAGASHFVNELLPGFVENCPISSSDHEHLLQNVGPCFDQVRDAGEIGYIANAVAKTAVPPTAAALRGLVNYFCPNGIQVPGIMSNSNDSFERFQVSTKLLLGESLSTREELFSNEVDTLSNLRVRATDGSFFLRVGSTVQLKVTRINSNGSESDVTADSLFHVLVGDGSVTVTPQGLLSIRKAFPLAGVTPPFYVVVRQGDDFALGQFAVTDTDTDTDGIVDTVERSLGTDPAVTNGTGSDLDADGLNDFQESSRGLNPRKGDTDGDRIDDGTEDRYNLNPKKPSAHLLTRQRGVIHFAITNLRNGVVVIRNTTTAQGTASNIILGAGEPYRAAYYNPATRNVGAVDFVSGPNGSRVDIPIAIMKRSLAGDSDGDGMPDDGELIVGTNPSNPDSDGDGVQDGAELEQGTDPLDGRQARTGIIATAPTPGEAVDVNALDDLVAVGTSSAGVTIFNVFNGMNPVAIAQVDTPGDARQVAFSGRTIAVADGAAGVAVIDATEPASARIARQVTLTGSVQAVTASAGIAYAGTETGRLAAIDLASGSVLQEVIGLGAVHDVAIEGDVLFVATYNELRAYGLASLDFLGKTNLSYSPEGITHRRRLFVGGGTAYVTSYPGYDAINVTPPSTMSVTGAARDIGPNSFKQIVANGSGLGVAAVGVNPRVDGTHDVWLYDVSDRTVTTRLLTVLATPGLTRAVSIYNGLAYAADGGSGLQVVNYLAFDTLGVAPTITLQTNFASGVAEEGKAMRLTASVTDDVQVRSVDFYVDDVKVVTDGNFPFEHRFITPLLANQPSFTVRACASDTGGNRTCTATSTVTLTTDATPPRVLSTTPANAASVSVGTISAVSATFSEAIADGSLTGTTFRVFAAGPDGVPGNGDDVVVPGGTIEFREATNAAFLTFATPLADNNYRVVISGAVTDRKGNPLGADHVWTFRVRGPLAWINAAGGRWSDPANWNEGVVPGPSDNARILLPGNYTVTVDQSVTVANLLIGGAGSTPTVWVNGGSVGGHVTLTVNDTIDNSGTIRVESTHSSWFSRVTTPGSLINRGTVRTEAGTGGDRNLTIAQFLNSGTFQVNVGTTLSGHLTNSGTVTVASGHTLVIPNGFSFSHDAGTISGAGVLQLQTATFHFDGGTTTGTPPLLISSQLNFSPSAATSTAAFSLTGNSRVTGASSPAHTLWIRGSSIGSHTTVTAPTGFTNGGTMRLESIDSSWQTHFTTTTGALTNTGTININVGTAGSRIITGAIDNRGAINVNADVTFNGNLTNSGTVTTAASRQLTLSNRIVELDGGTIANNGTVLLNSASVVNFDGGTATGNPVILINSTLNFGTATGAATFVMSGTGTMNGTIQPGQTAWVRGSGIGSHTTITMGAGFINRGTIRIESIDSSWVSHLTGNLTNAVGGVVNVNPGTGGSRNLTGNWTNEGTLNVNTATTFTGPFTNHGTVAIAVNQKLTHSGTTPLFHQNGGTITSTGTYEQLNGTFHLNGGTTTGNPLYLINAVVTMNAPGSPASLLMTGGSSKLSGTIDPAQTVWVNGNSRGSHTTLTSNPTFVNEGTLRVESSDSSYTSHLAGTFTNAPTGTIRLVGGAGGTRDVSGTFTNDGTILVNTASRWSGTITNAGTVTIAASQQLTLSGTTITLRQNSGSINGPGSLRLENITFEFGGGTITAPLIIVNGRISLGSSTDVVLLTVTGQPVISGFINAGQTLWVQGSSGGGHTTLNLPEGLVNNGTIRLQSVDSSYTSSITIPAGQTLTNGGTIESNPGSGGTRVVTGNFVNNGTVAVNHAMTWTGTLTNNGAVNIVAGQRFTHSGAGTFHNNTGGTVSNAGTFDLQGGGVFHQNAGTATGNPIYLQNTTLVLSGSGAGAFTMSGGSPQLQGNISAGQTIWAQGNSTAGHTTLRAPASFTNNGVLRLESRDSSYSSNLLVTGTFTNAATLLLGAGSGGTREINGIAVNDGTISVALPMTWAGTFTNNGAINVAAGQRITHSGTGEFRNDGGTIANLGAFDLTSGGTFRQNGGALTGNAMNITTGRLVLGGAGAGSFTFSGNGQLEGTIASTQTVLISGNSSGGNVTVNAPAGLTNAGLLRLQSRDSSYSTGLSVTGTLTNSGTVDIGPGSGGARTLNGILANSGIFDVRQPLTFNGTAFANNAGGTLRGGSSLTLSNGAATLTNAGAIAPGTSPGTLTIPRVTQSATGSVDVEIGGLAAGTAYDRLAVTGAAALDGAINVSLINGYVPNLGDVFDVVTFGTRTGTFASLNGATIGGGKKFQVSYGTGKVTLTVVPE